MFMINNKSYFYLKNKIYFKKTAFSSLARINNRLQSMANSSNWLQTLASNCKPLQMLARKPH